MIYLVVFILMLIVIWLGYEIGNDPYLDDDGNFHKDSNK